MSLLDHSPGWHHRDHLPHFDVPQAWQAVTFRLADSLPRGVLESLELAVAQRPMDEQDQARRRLIQERLDAGLGACVLRADGDIVAEVLLAGDGQEYRLAAWVVMPNHVHVLVGPVGEQSRPPLAAVVQRWKGASARLLNHRLGTTGRLWQPDYFDRYLRDHDHGLRTIAYILDNPILANLVTRREDWPWSSVNSRFAGGRTSVRGEKPTAD